MKNIAFFLFFILIGGLNTQAQNPDRFPVLRERILQAKLHEIKAVLKLDQPTFMRFRPIYVRYEREIARIDFRTQARLMKVDADSLSPQEADQMIINQMKNARMLINVREKYYKEFSAVLAPQQIIKLYQTEAELRKKVMMELRKRNQKKAPSDNE